MTASTDERALRVLAADDHPTNRAVIQMILDLIGADLVCVEDGAQAVEAFRAGEFDMVLMDLQMPVMDGLSAIREMRKMEAEARRYTPILAVSANAMSDHIAASKQAGADAHIAKPVVPNALIESISALLETARTKGPVQGIAAHAGAA